MGSRAQRQVPKDLEKKKKKAYKKADSSEKPLSEKLIILALVMPVLARQLTTWRV